MAVVLLPSHAVSVVAARLVGLVGIVGWWSWCRCDADLAVMMMMAMHDDEKPEWNGMEAKWRGAMEENGGENSTNSLALLTGINRLQCRHIIFVHSLV